LAPKSSPAPRVLPEMPPAPRAARETPPAPLPAAVPGPGPRLPGEAFTLPQLLKLAAENHPDLAVAHARSEAARGRLVQAGLYPNPVVTARSDEIGAPGGKNNGDYGKPGVTIAQEIVTAGKLRFAQAAAGQGVQAADWQA